MNIRESYFFDIYKLFIKFWILYEYLLFYYYLLFNKNKIINIYIYIVLEKSKYFTNIFI